MGVTPSLHHLLDSCCGFQLSENISGGEALMENGQRVTLGKCDQFSFEGKLHSEVVDILSFAEVLVML